MAQGSWRPGMATRCAKCGGTTLTYSEDGSAQCATCGGVTAPVWAVTLKPAPPTPPTPEVEARPPLRFVTPPGESAATPQASPAAPVILGPPSRRRSFSAADIRRNRIIAGAVLIVLGLVVTAGTYSLAASSPTGGTYFVAFGPVLFGLYLVAKGLTTPAGVPVLARRPGTRRSVEALAPMSRVTSPAPIPGTSRVAARGTKWPLLVFLLGLALVIVGESVSLMNFAAAAIVGDALGFPGFFLLILAPIWWAIPRLRRNARRTHL